MNWLVESINNLFLHYLGYCIERLLSALISEASWPSWGRRRKCTLLLRNLTIKFMHIPSGGGISFDGKTKNRASLQSITEGYMVPNTDEHGIRWSNVKMLKQTKKWITSCFWECFFNSLTRCILEAIPEEVWASMRHFLPTLKPIYINKRRHTPYRVWPFSDTTSHISCIPALPNYNSPTALYFASRLLAAPRYTE